MSCSNECRKPRGRQAHCGAEGCHRTFTGVSTFDQHRVGGKCDMETPARVRRSRMTEKDGIWGFWGTSAGREWWKAA